MKNDFFFFKISQIDFFFRSKSTRRQENKNYAENWLPHWHLNDTGEKCDPRMWDRRKEDRLKLVTKIQEIVKKKQQQNNKYEIGDTDRIETVELNWNFHHLPCVQCKMFIHMSLKIETDNTVFYHIYFKRKQFAFT